MPIEGAAGGSLAEQLADAFRLAVEALREAGTDFAVVGGLAVNVLGTTRTTVDADFVMRLPRVRMPGLVEGLARRGFGLAPDATARLSRESFLTATFGRTRVDFLHADDPLHQQALRDARAEMVLGAEVKVARPEDLILTKLIAARRKDLDDIQELLVTQRAKLDLERIREWLPAIEKMTPDVRATFEKLVREFYEP